MREKGGHPLKRYIIYKSLIILLCTILFIGLFFIEQEKASTHETFTPQPLVAHAGGAIYGFRYTNSLEALEKSYENGFQLIEIDFEWTTDGNVVAIHDWGPMVERLFMTEGRVFTLEEFKNSKTFQSLTLMELDDLAQWLQNHPDTYIITDAKRRNIEFLKLISENHPDIQNQIIPQIYYFSEYQPVKKMGYENIILTLYRLNNSDEEIVSFVKMNPVFAVTMPIEHGFSQLPSMLRDVNIPTYVHTVNDLSTYEKLRENGVFGIYTDYFEANHWVD